MIRAHVVNYYKVGIKHRIIKVRFIDKNVLFLYLFNVCEC